VPVLVSGAEAPLYYVARVAPTVLRQGPYRFYFFAGDRAEPAHIHVEGADGEAKFWLRPVAQADAWGYSARELRTIRHIVVTHRDEFLQAWDAFFST
jgi:Domain of unknown function (DUF4160)